MTRRVEGKVALVTGAANGIGRSAALVLAREGAKIAATDLQDEKGAGLLGELRAMECERPGHRRDGAGYRPRRQGLRRQRDFCHKRK